MTGVSKPRPDRHSDSVEIMEYFALNLHTAETANTKIGKRHDSILLRRSSPASQNVPDDKLDAGSRDLEVDGQGSWAQ